MVSRMWSRPQIQATVRSTPRPNPLCGTAVAPQVEIPVIGLARQAVPVNRRQQHFRVAHALAPPMISP